jgi:hypothetical protein
MPDLLEREAVSEILVNDPEFQTKQLGLLADIRRGIKRLSPGAICQLKMEFTGATPGYITGTDKVRIRFINNNQFVKATAILISNASTKNIGFTIDQPIVQLGAVNTGHELATAAVVPHYITGEVDFMEIALSDAGPTTVSINNSAALTANGAVILTAWTIPEDGR